MPAEQPRRGRPPATYETSWGERVPGLTRVGESRWRSRSVLGRDVTFTEKDERAAVARFRLMAAEAGITLPPANQLAADLLATEMSPAERLAWAKAHLARVDAGSAALQAQLFAMHAARDLTSIGSGELAIGSAGALWRWVASVINSSPEEAAKGLGIPASALEGLRGALPPTS